MAKGKLLVIEGIDGAGKGTQAARLVETAGAHGLSATAFSFPLYDGNPFSRAIVDYLNGELGGLEDVHPALAALLYAGDRLHARPRLLAALAEHDLVVCDRYVASNLAHQGAKLEGGERERLLAWVDEIEFGEFALPRPDLVVLLDAPATLARELVGRKGARAYTELAADIHERDVEHGDASREIYLELAARDGWSVVGTAAPDGSPRPVEEVGAEIWRVVERLVA